MTKKKLIVIIGPTAIGKTALAIDVAKHLDSEIISSDSRQFFKEMKIGTAVPTEDELAAVKHHFVRHLSINEPYSVGDFERDALHFMAEYFRNKNILVMVGGSGLYEKAVTEGLDNFPKVDSKIRIDLNDELQQFGLKKLQQELLSKDPEYFRIAEVQNPHRVIRALEVIRGSGQPFSSFLNKNVQKRDFEVIKIGLQLPREIVYHRINDRVNKMMAEGLLKEAEELYKFRELNALQTVGYKELFQYFSGEISLETAIEEIKKNTRRFAKRQLTWYRKDEKVTWFAPDQLEEIILFLERKMAD